MANAFCFIGQELVHITKADLTNKTSRGALPRAQSYAFQNAFGSAVNDLNAAIEINDHASELYASRGHMFLQLKEYVQANEDYLRAIKLSPNDSIYYVWMARALVEEGIYDRAVDYFTAAIDRDPSNPALYRGRSKAYLNSIRRTKQTKMKSRPQAFPNGRSSNSISELKELFGRYSKCIDKCVAGFLF